MNAKSSTLRSLTATVIAFLVLLPRIDVAAETGPTQDIGWPRQVSREGATLVYYQPQLDEWKDYKALIGRVAFSLQPQGGQPVLGVANFQSETLVDKDSHTVFFRDINVTSVRFPSLNATAAAPMEQLFRKLAPIGAEPISLDRVIADLQSGKVAAPSVALKNDPPQIFSSTKPARGQYQEWVGDSLEH